MKRIKLTFLAILFIGILFLAGCGGNKTEGAAGNSKENGAADIFESKPAEYKVTYNVEQTLNGETSKFIQKVSSKGKDKTKIELATSEGSMITYSLEQENYLCDIVNGKESCMKGPSGSSGVGLDLTKSIDSIKKQLNQPSTTRTIAGATASCYKTSAMGIDAEACASKEGVPLYLNILSEDGSKVVYDAFEYSTKVSDEDMTPKNIVENIFTQDLNDGGVTDEESSDTTGQDL